MNGKIPRNHAFNRMFVNILSIFVIATMAFPVTTVAHAAPASPFIGHWEATDVDGSDMTLSIGGRRNGPFKITWTDDYISFCDGQPGIGRGTGQLNESDPNLLEADVHLECFTTGAVLDFHVTFRYHPATNTLSVRWDFGQVTIWYRSGRQLPPPPALSLRVNYGHDWVESFYEGGHMAWITITDADGNVKATSELMTEPKDYWGGETGFQSIDSVWFDEYENQMENPPDIQPNDWVYGWVDNGASAQVQIGDISGTIDLETDSIEGTINAPWFSVPVQVECLDWGSGQEPPFDNQDGGLKLTDGADPYSCSWLGEWDIQHGQNVGVSYFGPDGHWVANAFYVRPLVLYIHYEYPDVVEGDYELGHTVQVTVFDSEWNTKATATVNTMEMPHWGGAPGFRVEQWDGIEGPPDIQPGDVIRAIVDDGLLTTEARVGEITGMIDLDTNSVTGTINAPWEGDIVNVLCSPWGAPEGTSEKETTVAPDGISEFTCTWDSEWDIQPGETVGVSYYGNDLHSVANAISNPWIMAFPDANQVFGYGWPVGSEVNLTINSEDIATAIVEGAPWDANDIMAFFDFNGIHDLVAGDQVVLSGSGVVRTHIVQNLAVTEVSMETDTVSGTADPGATVHTWVHGFGHDVWLTVTDDPWVANFGSDGFQLEPGMCGRAEILVEGNNSTNVDWCIPNPMIIAHPDQEWVEGWSFQDGSEVELTIYDGGGIQMYRDTATAAPPDWDPGNPNAFVRFDVGYDLKAGDHLWMTDGTFTKDLIVTALMPTGIDIGGQIVYGVADPNSEVTLEHQGEMWAVTADPEGNWFATLPVLARGSDVLASQWDDDGDMTRIAYHIPNTRFTVWPQQNYLEGYEWPDGALVSISVADKDVCSTEVVSGYPEWDPSNTFFSVNFPEGCTIEPSDLITLSFEPLSFTHQVQELAITEVNLDNSTVAGTAAFDSEQSLLHTWIHGVDGSYMQLSAEGGAWLADFGLQGFELQPGMGGRVELVDQASNATAVEWSIPKIEIKAFPMADVVWGYGWPEGSQVHLTLNGVADFVPPATVGPAPWGDPNDIMAYFELTGYNLVPGDVVSLSGSGLEQTHTVRNLSVTAVDAVANTVTGTADEELYVWVHGFDGTELHLTPQDGKWMADFGSIPFDLMDGMCGRAEIGDEAGNSTAADWCVPPPSRIVVQITDDWFRAENFTPNGELTFWVYEAEGGQLLRHPENTWQLDGSGYVTVSMWELAEYVDLVPGNYLVVTDGTITRELVLEAFTFDVFDVTNGHLEGTAPEPSGRTVWVGVGVENDAWIMEVTTDLNGNWNADFGAPVPSDYQWVAAQIFDEDGDASELRPASEIIFLRPRCGSTYTVQANIPLEIRYGSWLAIGEDLAIQNAQHLTVNLVLDGELVTGSQQPVVPGSEIPCGAPADAYGVFYVTQVGPLSAGTHVASVTWILDEQVTDGFDADGDGVPDLYGPGEVFTHEFTIIVQ